jgi:predicted permease
VATLAAGLGANATIFSVVDSVILRSLPYEAPEQLVAVWSTVQRDLDQPASIERRSFSIPDLVDLQQRSEHFESLAGYTNASFRLGGERPDRVVATLADAQYLTTLGVQPLLGNDLSSERIGEGAVPGVVLSHGFWQRQFGGDRSIVGHIIDLDGDSAEIVGVLPAGFRGLVDGSDLLYPLGAVGERPWTSRGSRWLEAVARLKPGSSVAQASEELVAHCAHLESEYPQSNRGYSAAARPLQEELVGDLRTPLLLLWAAVAAVLLVATLNVVNLLIVHFARRATDFSVARALGATSGRLLSRIASEALLLSVAGAVVGIVGAVLALRFLQPFSPIDLPGLFSVQIGGRALLFALILALLLGSAVTAVLTVRTLKAGSTPSQLGGSPAGSQRATQRDNLRGVLLVSEVALATVLTVAAGLLVRSFWNLSDVDPGMARSQVGFLNLDVSPDIAPESRPGARAKLLEAVASTAGVEAAALASDSPFHGASSATLVSPAGVPRDENLPYSGAARVYRHMVSPEYFSVLGISLLRGRAFDREDALAPDDSASGPDAPGVAVVTAEFARKTWPAADALGQRFYLGSPTQEESEGQRRPWFEVVGIVADHRQRSLVATAGEPGDPDVFFALEQFNPANTTLLVRSALPTGELLRQLTRRLTTIDPELVVYAPETIAGRLAQQTARARFSGLMISAFAGLALLLAAIGIYGVVAYSVLQRRREIGIRMALGADRARVVREVARAPLVLVAAGLGLGLMAAAISGRLVQSLLFEISTLDLRAFSFGLVLLGVVGALAAAVPARRASRVEPSEALRAE